MTEKPRVFVFHLFRADGQSLMLHPFGTPEKLVSALEQGEILGRYGKDPRIESIMVFRAEVYRLIDAAVRRWRANVRFIPKFLVSSGVFFVVYFFSAFAIRSPLPLAADLLIALTLCLVTYLAIGRKDARSGVASQRRLALIATADKIPLTESEFVKKAEVILHRNESRAMEEVLREIIAPSLQELAGQEREEAMQFLALLEGRFDSRKRKREERLAKKLVSDSRRLSRQAKVQSFDFPLYAVYKSLKRSVAEKKA